MPGRVDDRERFYRRVLGDARYAERHRFPKWNVEPTVIQEPRLFPRVFPELTREDHERLARELEEKGLRVREQYRRRLAKDVEIYGEQGPLISAIGRGEHYPESVKEHLRILAHGSSLLLDAAEAHRRAARLRSLPRRDPERREQRGTKPWTRREIGPTGAVVWHLPRRPDQDPSSPPWIILWPGPGARLQFGSPAWRSTSLVYIDHPSADGNYYSRADAESAVRRFLSS